MARRNPAAFEKLQRDRAKRERAEAKRERKAEREAGEGEPGRSEEETNALLAELAEIHKRYEDEEITLEALEERRAEITELLAES